MALKLTPQVIKHGYELLSATEPFIKWNLPDSDDVSFKIGRDKNLHGWYKYCYTNTPHMIVVSRNCVGNLATLLETLGHEMIHLHIEAAGIKDTSAHGRAFQKFALQVCKVHPHFDHKRF